MSTRPRNFDAAVVGAGPSGAVCALLLARAGARVGLIHRADSRVRGVELISGRARRLVERHREDFFRLAVHGVEVRETVSLWGTPDPVTWNAMLDPWGPGVAVDRAAFDGALRDLARDAGATILPAAEVLGCGRRGARWCLDLRREAGSCTMSAGLLIVATGRGGGRFLNRAAAARSTHVALMTRLRARGCRQGHALYLEASDNGWWYALPDRGGGHFVGLCVGRDEARRRRAPLREFFVRELRRTRLLAPLLPNAEVDQPILGRPAGVQAPDQVAGPGWVAVGDAAFAPDPLSGMGLDFALESAVRAAGAVRPGVASENFGDYEQWVAAYAWQHAGARELYYRADAVSQN